MFRWSQRILFVVDSLLRYLWLGDSELCGVCRIVYDVIILCVADILDKYTAVLYYSGCSRVKFVLVVVVFLQALDSL